MCVIEYSLFFDIGSILKYSMTNMEDSINYEDRELVKQFHLELHRGYKDSTEIVECYKDLVPRYDQVMAIITTDWAKY